ncbi:MAG TPA: FAD-dependent oxidoreductase [Streptosporangiaceae bacterium]|nr:FAD-dependent oxidoreductase [Streptosporangiaceae bacterium]
MGDISRREVLGGTGRLAIAAGLGTQAGWLLPSASPNRRTHQRTRPLPQSRPDWAALGRHLHGRLLRPGDTGYVVASVPYNRRYADIRPAGVALCADVTDVRTALRWARHYDVPFAIRSGGHSYGGYSTSHGLVISLARMNSVRVNGKSMTVTVGPGARNRDLYAGLAGTGVAVPSGRCPTVGVSGLLLGGGFGFSSRHLGLTCDQLLETEVVTASGAMLRVSPQSHPDLFWACQGGGGGNFGINTGYTFRATRVGDVSVYRLEWSWRQATTALSAMLGLMASAPDTLSCRVGLDVSGGGPATGGTPRRGVSALGLYFGPSRELAGLLAPVLAAAWPSEQLIEDRGYLGAQAMLAHSVPFDRFASKSRFLDGPLSAAGLETAVRWIERWPGSSNPGGGGVTIFAWGGAISRVAPAATAFVHRDAAFLMDNETTWTARDSPRVVHANLGWVAGIYDALAPFGTRQAYQNFIDPALRDWQSAYYGENLPRLMRIKRRYDPDEVFRFAQAIPEAPAP